MVSDNFPLLNSRRKNYILLISLIEVFLYFFLLYAIKERFSTFIIVIGNMIAKTTNTWWGVIIFGLIVSLKELHVLKSQKLDFKSSTESTSNFYFFRFLGKMVSFGLISFLYDKIHYYFFLIFSILALISFVITFYLIEPPFHGMDFKIFKDKLIQSKNLIIDNKIYYILLVIVFSRGAPSLVESSEYYYTETLKFSNFVFGLKNLLMTACVVLAVLVIKYQFVNSYKKSTLAFFNFLLVITSVMSLFIFEKYIGLSVQLKYVLAYVRAMLWNFSIESVIIICLNIYITFCPKDIEATFSTFYLSISATSLEIGTILANVIIRGYNIKIANGFRNIEFLVIFNIFFVMVVFLWV